MDKKTISIIGVILLIVIIGIFIFIDNNKYSTNKKDNSNIDDNDYKIINTTEKCVEEKEKIYEDNLYIYYLPCISSQNISLKYKDGKTILLTEAIEQKIVTIEELVNNGLKLEKEKV